MSYVELQVTSHYSFLRGAASPEELFSAAAMLGYSALGITDRNTVGGLVRGLRGEKETGVRLIAGKVRKGNASSIGKMSPPGATGWLRPWCRTRPME